MQTRNRPTAPRQRYRARVAVPTGTAAVSVPAAIVTPAVAALPSVGRKAMDDAHRFGGCCAAGRAALCGGPRATNRGPLTSCYFFVVNSKLTSLSPATKVCFNSDCALYRAGIRLRTSSTIGLSGVS